MPKRCIEVSIPGSTSNFGSGFDTLGMAVNLYQGVKLERLEADDGENIEILPANGPCASAKLVELIEEASDLYWKISGQRRFAFRVGLSGDLPVGKGLGASGALRAGLISGLSHLAGNAAPLQEVLNARPIWSTTRTMCRPR